MLRVDGAIPFDAIEAMTEAELHDEWDAFVSLVEKKNEAQREEIERSRRTR